MKSFKEFLGEEKLDESYINSKLVDISFDKKIVTVTPNINKSQMFKSNDLINDPTKAKQLKVILKSLHSDVSELVDVFNKSVNEIANKRVLEINSLMRQ